MNSHQAGPALFGGLAADMRGLHQESFTGALLVFGPPDTTLHFRDGLLVAAQTPGAPGPDTLLIRSGSVPGRTWAPVREHALTTGDLGAELLNAGHVSGALLELTLVRALLDGVFALGLSPSNRGGEVRPGAPPPPLFLAEGREPGWAVQEAARRHGAIDRLWGPPADLARLRPVAAAPPEKASSAAHRDLLARADGRRTPRDLAFVQGRDVSGVMTDLARLAARGLVDTGTRRSEGVLTRRLPERKRTAPETGPLTKRRPGTSGMRPAPRADSALSPKLAARLSASLRNPGGGGGGEG
ncbi:hypothetical protein [Nocardiopsis oceani]